MSLPLVSKGSVAKHVDKENHDVLADPAHLITAIEIEVYMCACVSAHVCT